MNDKFNSLEGFITQFLNFVFCTSAGSLILSSEISTNTKFDPDDEDIHLRLPVSGKEEFRLVSVEFFMTKPTQVTYHHSPPPAQESQFQE